MTSAEKSKVNLDLLGLIHSHSLISLNISRGSAVAQWKSACLERERPRARASPALLHCGP